MTTPRRARFGLLATATVLATSTIDTVPANFPSVARPSGFVKSMVEMDEVLEHLKAIEKAEAKAAKDAERAAAKAAKEAADAEKQAA